MAGSAYPHLLLLMRHAEAVEIVPGKPDFDRPLTDNGRAQAARAAAYLADQGIRPDAVLCSGAVRAAQTAELLDLHRPIEHSSILYNAGSHIIREEIEALPEEIGSVLVLAHAPGIPTLAHDLTEVSVSDPAVVQAIEWGFQPATLVGIELAQPWANLTRGRLKFAAHF